jgi:HNH endonuclease
VVRVVKASAFSDEVKERIYTRARGLCDRCGMALPGGMHFHHRNPRRMGGSDDAALGLPSNGLLLHPSCHDYIESHRKVAAQLGYILGATQNPMEWPVYLWHGWCWLNEDGTFERLGKVPAVNERRQAPA